MIKLILILTLAAMASIHCRPVYSGGPDSQDQWSLPHGGDCYQFTEKST